MDVWWGISTEREYTTPAFGVFLNYRPSKRTRPHRIPCSSDWPFVGFWAVRQWTNPEVLLTRPTRSTYFYASASNSPILVTYTSVREHRIPAAVARNRCKQQTLILQTWTNQTDHRTLALSSWVTLFKQKLTFLNLTSIIASSKRRACT